jgi:cytochrome c oxidase subunit IV
MLQPMPKPRTYMIIYVALMLLLALTIGAAFVPFDQILPGRGWSIAIALSIAIAKGVLILLFFMHVKYTPRITWAFAGAGFLWLGIMLVLTMSDYLIRNHPPEAMYKGERRYLQVEVSR